MFEVLTLSDDDSELAIIRRKKMAKIVAREKQLQATKEKEEKIEAERSNLLKRYLASDAYEYLKRLKKNQPGIGNRVEEIILYLIVYRGLRQTISQLDVRYIERQIRGEGPKIRVQRNGETSDFGAYVKEAIRKGTNKPSD
ncbi:MAG: hypothetical protein JSW61_11785 [Candidatus Thorarchaeota archaeon]|nr:MAG: hypothetical protein JSW61_11785 [Candidatus Thorarchaeota archaeon]